MSTAEDYRPCLNCGVLTDSFVCSESCVHDLEAADAAKAEAQEERDAADSEE
jgi:hypothetical protein